MWCASSAAGRDGDLTARGADPNWEIQLLSGTLLEGDALAPMASAASWCRPRGWAPLAEQDGGGDAGSSVTRIARPQPT